MPAAGYRHVTTGALTNVGTEGDYWSSSSYASGNINAGFMSFNATWVNPVNNTNRANGLAVRCVQHLLAGAVLMRGRKMKKLVRKRNKQLADPEWREPRSPPVRSKQIPQSADDCR